MDPRWTRPETHHTQRYIPPTIPTVTSPNTMTVRWGHGTDTISMSAIEEFMADRHVTPTGTGGWTIQISDT